MKRILLIGFEPFHNYKINSSWSLVESFENTTSGFDFIKLRLPVEFKVIVATTMPIKTMNIHNFQNSKIVYLL